MILYGFILTPYIFFRAILPLKIHWGWKVLLTVLTALTAFKNNLLFWLGGPLFFAPDLSPFILWSAIILFALLIFFFILLLASDIVLLVRKIISAYRKYRCALQGKPSPEIRNIPLNKLNLILFSTAVLLTAAGLYNGIKIPSVKHETVTYDKDSHLPFKADGLKIAVLADLHADKLSTPGQLRKIVQKTNAEKPDVILLLGDLADGTPQKISHILEPLKELHAKYGVYLVPGNHEYYSGFAPWMRYFTEQGHMVLLNQNHYIQEKDIWICGVADPAGKRTKDIQPDLTATFKNIPPHAFTILMSHRPDTVAKAGHKGADLQFSGHTHGGMFRGLDYLVGRFNRGFVSGWYDQGKGKVYVSNGSGIWKGFPIRLGRPSEITIFILQKK